jgi:hypothetical protein
MIHPLEASHRSATIGVDLAVIYAKTIDLLTPYISKEELFHIQMNALYVLIDIMGATSNADPQHVLDQARQYFKNLERERDTV